MPTFSKFDEHDREEDVEQAEEPTRQEHSQREAGVPAV